MGYTKATKASEIKQNWHLVDVKDKILGRISTDIAQLLMGKDKRNFVRHMNIGDYVVVINAADIKVTGNKKENKEYVRYTGYPSGLRTEKFKDLLKRRPTEIVRRSVSGMLPKNKLRKKMLSQLFIYPGAKHPYENKIQS